MNKMFKKGLIMAFYLAIIVLACILIYNKFNNEKTNKDGAKFAQEYRMVDSKNSFVYKSSEEIIKILENGTGIVFFGFPQCTWCQYYVKFIDEVARETETKIYYYNILEDRKNNTETYKRIVELLKGTLQYDADGNERIYVPHVAVVIKGEIIDSDYESSLDTGGFENPSLYWTEEKKDNLKNKLKVSFEKIFQELNSCTKCN